MTSIRLCAMAIAVAILGLSPNGTQAKSGGHSTSSHANITTSTSEAKKAKKQSTKPKLQDLSVTKKQDKASPQ